MSIPETPSDVQPARPDAPISFRGSLSVPDAYAAISLAQPLGNKIATWVVRAFFVLALIYMCCVTAHAYYNSEYNFARMAFAGVMLCLFPISVAIGRNIWYRKRASQLCKEGKLLYEPTEGEIDGNSIRVKSESGEVALNWSAFCSYRETETVAILYHHYPASYVIMARSKFANDQDWSGFLQLAGQKLRQI